MSSKHFQIQGKKMFLCTDLTFKKNGCTEYEWGSYAGKNFTEAKKQNNKSSALSKTVDPEESLPIITPMPDSLIKNISAASKVLESNVPKVRSR